MKIIHVSLIGPVTDGFTYQDNLLPKFHKLIGNEVIMITSKYVYNKKGEIIKTNKNDYFNEFGIRTIRLNEIFPFGFKFKFKVFDQLSNKLEELKPDLIFVHGVQFLDLITIKNYTKKNNIKLIVDNHAYFSNSARNFFSYWFLHRFIWKNIVKFADKLISTYFGVTPARISFLNKVYDVSKDKIKLLPLGHDDTAITNDSSLIERINSLNLSKKAIIFSTGGKIDKAKIETFNLINAFNIKKEKNQVLLVFGSIDKELKDNFFDLLSHNKNIHYLGWLNSEQIRTLILYSSIIIFPGRHSVLWEECVALGKPLVLINNIYSRYLDIGGNILFLKSSKILDFSQMFELFNNNPEIIKNLTINAMSEKRKKFYYSTIAIESLK